MDLQEFNKQAKIIASQFYSDLHYHNFLHAEETHETAYRTADLLLMDEIEYLAISRSALMHDAGYHLPLDTTIFPTKEDLSIHLMKENSVKLFGKFPWINKSDQNKIVALAADGIEGTKILCRDFSSELRKILRAADISHLGTDNIEEFLSKSAKIYHEYSFLNKDYLEKEGLLPVPQRIFQRKQSEILDTILHNTLQQIPEEPYFPKGFYAQFAKNIEILRTLDDFQHYIDKTAH